MKRLWLVFSQAVTVLLAAWFVVATLKPDWLGRRPSLPAVGSVSLIEAPPPPATVLMCQSAPSLLSHVPAPLLNTMSSTVALPGTANV